MTAPTWLRWAWIAPAGFLLAFMVVPLASLAGQVLSPGTIEYVSDSLPWRVTALATAQALALSLIHN